MNWLRFDSMFWIGVSPLDRRGSFIVVANITQQFGAQVRQRVKNTARDHLPLNFGEPVFDLVEPGGIGRGEVNADVGIRYQKSIHQLRLVRRKVVGNDMDFFASRLGGDHVGQKTHELGAGMVAGGLAKDFAALDFEGGVKRKRAVAKVFKTMRLCPAGGKWQDGIEPIQRLNSALFIHTENGGVRRRVQIESDNVRRFGFKVRVVADHVMAQAMRLQTITSPDTSHRHVGGSQFPRQAAGTPVRAAIIGSTSCPLQNPGFQLGGPFGHHAALMPGYQTRHTFRTETSAPPLHIRRAARQIRRRAPQATTAGQFQNHPRPSGILRSQTARAHAALQFPAFWRSKNQAFGGHTPILSVAWPISMLHCTSPCFLVKHE